MFFEEYETMLLEREGPLSLDRMLDKALRLVETGRVERLNHERFNVIGDHGTYFVIQTYNGKISCNCQGFQNRGRCSHSAAVLILLARGDKL